MSGPNHIRRIAILTIVATLIALPLVIWVLGPALPPGNGSEQAAGQVTDNTVLTALVTPFVCFIVVFFAYCADRLPPARRRDRGGRGDPRRPAGADALDRPHLGARDLHGRLRHLRAAAERLRRGAGPRPDRRAARREVPGAGDRPAVAVHLPLPDLRRRRDLAARAPGRQADRAPRHLPRRRALVLGLRPRRQGRRDPRHRQRRLREHALAAELRHPLRRALRPLPRLHVRHGQGGLAAPSSRRGSSSSSRSSSRSRSTCRPTARPTPPIRRGGPDEAPAALRLQPPRSRSSSPRSATTSAGGSATRSTPRASTSSATRARTTSRCSSPTCSACVGFLGRARLPQLPLRADRRAAGHGRTTTRPRTRAAGRATSATRPTTRWSASST